MLVRSLRLDRVKLRVRAQIISVEPLIQGCNIYLYESPTFALKTVSLYVLEDETKEIRASFRHMVGNGRMNVFQEIL